MKKAKGSLLKKCTICYTLGGGGVRKSVFVTLFKNMV